MPDLTLVELRHGIRDFKIILEILGGIQFSYNESASNESFVAALATITMTYTYDGRKKDVMVFIPLWRRYMSIMASQITHDSIICSAGCSGLQQRNHQSSASLAFVRGIRRARWCGERFHVVKIILYLHASSDRHYYLNLWCQISDRCVGVLCVYPIYQCISRVVDKWLCFISALITSENDRSIKR